MSKQLIGHAALMAALIFPGVALADALSQLQAFSQSMDSFSASFEQTAYNADSEPLQSASGRVVLERPGRFRWHYLSPEEQFIVADGEKLWQYDVELEQANVSPLADRIGSTPLALLTERRPLDEQFVLTALGEADGIEWVELVPKQAGADFEQIFIGLRSGQLAAMELRDSLGQATQIVFSEFNLNPELDEAEFRLELPDGVDVIGLE